jgi:hypothetical protein
MQRKVQTLFAEFDLFEWPSRGSCLGLSVLSLSNVVGIRASILPLLNIDVYVFEN